MIVSWLRLDRIRSRVAESSTKITGDRSKAREVADVTNERRSAVGKKKERKRAFSSFMTMETVAR